MKINNQKANGNISKLIKIFNHNITILWEYKIKVLEPSENEEINMQDFLMYNTLKQDLIDILNEIDPKLNIEVVDGAKGISKNLICNINKIRKQDSYSKGKKCITIITTSDNDEFIERSKQIIKFEKLEFRKNYNNLSYSFQKPVFALAVKSNSDYYYCLDY